MSRLRTGEIVAGVGGILLLLSLLFFDWYGIGGSVDTPFGDITVGAEFGAWDHQGFWGTLANLIILAAALAGIALAVLTAGSRTVALPVATSALTAGLGFAAVVMVLTRILMQPGENSFVDLKYGIYIALLASVAVAWGGWQAMQDEGTSFGGERDRFQRRGSAGASAPRQSPPPRATEPPPPREPSVPGEPPPSSPPPGAPPPGT